MQLWCIWLFHFSSELHLNLHRSPAEFAKFQELELVLMKSIAWEANLASGPPTERITSSFTRETLWRLKYRMYRLHTAKMGTKSMEVVASLCCCPRCSSTLYKVILPEILHLRNSQQHPKTKEGEVRRFTIDRYACQDTSAYIHLLSSSILSIH